jgi:hypothetical protein
LSFEKNIKPPISGHRNTACAAKIDGVSAEKIIPADNSMRLFDEIIQQMDSTPLMRHTNVQACALMEL